jgi:hypothetical protein
MWSSLHPRATSPVRCSASDEARMLQGAKSVTRASPDDNAEALREQVHPEILRGVSSSPGSPKGMERRV